MLRYGVNKGAFLRSEMAMPKGKPQSVYTNRDPAIKNVYRDFREAVSACDRAIAVVLS